MIIKFALSHETVNSSYFTGDFQSLLNHWRQDARAKRFQSGGTRVQAVTTAIRLLREHMDPSNTLWLDTGCGAGFVEHRVLRCMESQSCHVFGLDFSQAMIQLAKSHVPLYALTSIFTPPLRNHSVDLVFTFFVLSDYQDLKPYFTAMSPLLRDNGLLAILDYEANDDYWQLRKKLHGIDGIIGNIHLRSITSMTAQIPRSFQVVSKSIITYLVPNSSISSYPSLLNLAYKHSIIPENVYHEKTKAPMKRSFFFMLLKQA